LNSFIVMKKQTERIVFIVALISGVLSLFLDYTLLPVILAFSSLIYLALGWHLLNPGEGNKFVFVYFWIGYSFSTVFLTLILVNYEVQLFKIFQYTVLAMLLLSIILMASVRKVREKGLVENILKTLLLIAIDIISIII